MEAHTAGATAPASEVQRLVITPVQGSLLDQLLDQQRAAKASLDEAKDRLDSLTARIKAELTQAHPGTGAFDIAGTQHRPAMHLTWVQTVRVDAKAMKTSEPETYARWAVFGGRWELRADRGVS